MYVGNRFAPSKEDINLLDHMVSVRKIKEAIIGANEIYKSSLEALAKEESTPHEVLGRVMNKFDSFLIGFPLISQQDKSELYALVIESYRRKLRIND